MCRRAAAEAVADGVRHGRKGAATVGDGRTTAGVSGGAGRTLGDSVEPGELSETSGGREGEDFGEGEGVV